MTMTPHHDERDEVVGDPNRLLKVRLTNFAIDAFLIAFGLAMLLPLVLLVANAFKTPQEILLWPPTIVPHDPTLENFKAVLERDPAPDLDLEQSAVRVPVDGVDHGDVGDRRLHPGQVLFREFSPSSLPPSLRPRSFRSRST